jgi:DnaK suppressor protein
MDAIQQQAMAAETQRRRRAELSQVRSALGRLKAGQWGDCLECGEPIAQRRLEHNPAVVLCIECARR